MEGAQAYRIGFNHKVVGQSDCFAGVFLDLNFMCLDAL